MRHDHDVIKHIYKLYGHEFTEALHRTPFFFIPREVEEKFSYKNKLGDEGFMLQREEYVVELHDSEEIERILPFHTFVICDHEIGWSHISYEGGGQWVIMFCMYNDNATIKKASKYLDIPLGALVAHGVRYNGTQKAADHTTEYSCVAQIAAVNPTITLKGANAPTPSWVTMLNSIFHEEQAVQDLTDRVTKSLQYFLAYFKWAESMHLVKETPLPTKRDIKTVKHGNKKPWTRSDMPSYIYLDAPRKPQEHSGTGEGKPLAHGHHRRAHWRTLSHPRFRNHPMYGKKVRVKATWVGPTEWKENNTIYTVHGMG